MTQNIEMVQGGFMNKLTSGDCVQNNMFGGQLVYQIKKSHIISVHPYLCGAKVEQVIAEQVLADASGT